MMSRGHDFKSVQQYYDHTHSIRFRLPNLIIRNKLAQREIERIDLAFRPVALYADNGVLYLGNVTFLDRPIVGKFVFDSYSRTTIHVSGAETGWNLQAQGLDLHGQDQKMECQLTRQVAEFRIQKSILEIRSSKV